MIAQQSRRIPSAVALLLIASLMTACGGTPGREAAGHAPPGVPARAKQPDSIGEHAVAIAMQQLGVPYRYGGHSPSGFDCSGLVHYSYRQAGRKVPRTTAQLWRDSVTVRKSDLRKGDLLFFAINGKMQHVGLYVGGERFIHSPSTGRQVTLESLQSRFYADALLRAARPY